MTFSVKEQDLAASLLPGPAMRMRIQELRERLLVCGQDYVKKGRDVMYSAGGVERLAAHLRGPINKKDAQAETQAVVESVMAELPKRRVRVVRVFASNPQYMHATLDDTAKTSVTVHVRLNKNFLPGMEMEVLRGVGGVWDYVGQLPRARGRW